MVIYLHTDHDFPDPSRDDVDELLGVGGDLSPERLVAAYSKGIFPWYSEDTPILWWSPDPRLIVEPCSFHVPRRLSRILKQNLFEFSVNKDFCGVINACATVDRPGCQGTWIIPEMIRAYTRLHYLGYAHSVEAWKNGRLAGGLYGIAIGKAFFGESMFYHVSNASKAALVKFVTYLHSWGFELIDCQQTTGHMLRFGAFEVSRKEFIGRLQNAVTALDHGELVWSPRSIE